MVEPTPQQSSTVRRDLLDALCGEFLHNYSKGRTLLAIDGPDPTATSTFADGLATRLGGGGHAVYRASIDNFSRSRHEREVRGVDTAQGFYAHSYDYDLFRRVLIEPFRMGGSTGFVTSAFDKERDVQVEMQWATGPRDATLIVDGLFLSRPELRGSWNFTVWLQAADGSESNGPRAAAQGLYQDESQPSTHASAIVENANPQLPRRIFADSC